MFSQIKNINTSLTNVKAIGKSERVLARLISKKLTSEEARKVAGGKVSCHATNYPSADVVCDV